MKNYKERIKERRRHVVHTGEKHLKRKGKTDDQQTESTVPTKKEFVLDIEKMDSEMLGVSHSGRKLYLASGALPREQVAVRFRATKDNVVKCRVERVIEANPNRVTPQCKYYDDCGGCSLLHASYDYQLQLKRKMVERALEGLKVRIDECVGCSIDGYRNKAHLAFTEKNGKVKLGFFNEVTHKVIPVRECLVHGAWLSEVIVTLEKWAEKNRLTAYNPLTSEGKLRFALIRKLGRNMLLTIVTADPKLYGLKELYGELAANFVEVGLYVSVNDKTTNDVYAGKLYHRYGVRKISGDMSGVNFKIGPQSFYQVNEQIAGMVYLRIRDLVTAAGVDSVVDAYSGIGITSMLFARFVKKVIAIEINRDAVDDMRDMIAAEGITNIEVICGDCSQVLGEIDIGNAAVFVDPPRRGLGQQALEAILSASPKCLLYLSCSLDSLRQDLECLTEGGYEIESVTPYDMFAATKHIECLVSLRNRG